MDPKKLSGRTTGESTATKAKSSYPGPTQIPISTPVKPGIQLHRGQKGTTPQVVARHYKASYFLPGWIEGRPMQLLIDDVCATNLLSKTVFDPLTVESQTHGLLADSIQLPFYDIIKLCRRRIRREPHQ